MPPPKAWLNEELAPVTELPLTVLSVRVSPAPVISMPPPPAWWGEDPVPVAVLFGPIVLFVIVRLPVAKMPPPVPLTPVAALSRTVTALRVSVLARPCNSQPATTASKRHLGRRESIRARDDAKVERGRGKTVGVLLQPVMRVRPPAPPGCSAARSHRPLRARAPRP